MKTLAFSPKQFILIGCMGLFCLFFNLGNALGQSDKERSYSDVIRVEEPSQSTKDVTSDYSVIKREQPEKPEEGRDYSSFREKGTSDERDNKQEGRSTLSFNLFLYVIDKFREN
jgi:hypothetical protein